MESTWYCKDCDERIDDDEVEAHENRGHTVQGKLRPDRLLEQDPWEREGESPEQ